MLKLLSDISADPSASSSPQNQGHVADGLALKVDAARPHLASDNTGAISRRNAFKPGYQILLRAGRKTWTCEAVSSRRSTRYTTLSTETARITSHSVGGGRSPQVLRVEATASQPGCPTGRVIKRRRRIAIVGTPISHLSAPGAAWVKPMAAPWPVLNLKWWDVASTSTFSTGFHPRPQLE